MVSDLTANQNQSDPLGFDSSLCNSRSTIEINELSVIPTDVPCCIQSDIGGNEGMETESAAVGKYDKDCGIGKCLLGRQVANYDEGLEMYKAHAHALGFSVRRGVTRKRPKTNELYEFYFYCSCEGWAQNEKPWAKKDSPVVRLPDLIIKEGESSEIKKKRKRRTVNITRCGCEALIRFKLDLESGFFVVVWHKVCHNHELAKANETHHLKSNRGINEDVGEVIRSMSNAGIKPMDSYNYLCLEVGGEELVGHTKKDHLNYINKMHMLDVEGGDMQSVLDMLDGKSSADNSFFYRVKVDDENHISCLFWRDSMMLEDFKVFGDLLITDTTHRTNKYNLICVPFVGINNHWLTTMFGCAFVTNEKSETFTWLLDAFKKSMHGIEPKTIFTDQDAALSNAIEKVFPRSNHRLCLWHLQRNFVSHFGNLKSDDSFKKKFDKCLMGCDGAEEFEKNWHEMVEKYGLKKREWFDRLYELRKKWCPALSRDMFSAGILSTQRVEGANHAISFKSNVTTSLYEFFQIFEQVVKRWRSKEVEENFKNRMEKPHSIFRAHPLLKHAAEVYTLRLFNDFNMEFDQALSSYIRADGVQGEFQFFEVSMESDYNRSHRVLCQLESEVFYCDCLCFNETKLLCYHILRIMHMHNVFNIPKMYIEKRWTKDAKLDVCLGINAEGEVKKGESSIIAWRHTMARNYYSLLMEYHSIPEARSKCEENLVQLAKELKEIGKKEGKEVDSVSNSSTCASTAKDDQECSTNDGIKDPVRRTAIKGRPKKPNIRIKGHFEKRKTATSRPNEYGTMTPNQRLI